ncbi:MAG: histidine phosphatase family protein [bacterium]
MRILFIRHADAVESEDFDGPDMDRPLTKRGAGAARATFEKLAATLPKPDVVISSEANRAAQTADIFVEAFGTRAKTVSSHLNPGCKEQDFRVLVAEWPKRTRYAVVVGHEPDFSQLVSWITANGRLVMKVKKGACIEVEMDEKCRGILRFAIPPELLAGT